VATLNIIWQRLWLPPKRPIQEVQPDVALVETAVLKEIILLVDAAKSNAPLPAAKVIQFVQQRQKAIQGFPPYDLLLEQLENEDTAGWQEKEQAIITQALQACLGWTLGREDKWPQKGQSKPVDVSSELAFSIASREIIKDFAD
jgi:hypothetical protein